MRLKRLIKRMAARVDIGTCGHLVATDVVKGECADDPLYLPAIKGVRQTLDEPKLLYISTQSDMVSAITGAIGALKGPLHGGAPAPALDMVFEIGDVANAEPYIR